MRELFGSVSAKSLTRKVTGALTGFLVAANVVLEIEGESSSIQSYLSNSTTSGSANLNVGGFSMSGSGAHSSSSSGSTCTSTASGCRSVLNVFVVWGDTLADGSDKRRIVIHNPQVIGWISQIVPALPRPKTRAIGGGK